MNRDLNPSGKPVVVFGPQVRRGLVRQLEEGGAIVVHTLKRAGSLGRTAMKNIVVVTPTEVTQLMVRTLIESLGEYWNSEETLNQGVVERGGAVSSIYQWIMNINMGLLWRPSSTLV